MALTSNRSAEGQLWIESIVSSTTHEGMVNARLGDVEFQATVEEARSIALRFLEAAEAAESDAALFEFYRKLGAGAEKASDKAMAMIQSWREFRRSRANKQ